MYSYVLNSNQVILLLDQVAKTIRVDLKGPDNTLRVRQIKVLGCDLSKQRESVKSDASFNIARRKCENETLRIFRLLSSEVNFFTDSS